MIIRHFIDNKKTHHEAEEFDFSERMFDDRLHIAEMVCSAAIKTLERGRDVSQVLELAQDATNWADRLVEKIKQKDPPRHPIACKKGCSFCCRMFRTHVMPTEVIQITEFLQRTFRKGALASIRDRIIELDEKTRGMSMQKRADSRLACALLTENRCGVYPVRPLRCRAYNSFDKKRCQLLYETGDLETNISYYHPQREIPFFVQTGIRAAIHASGYDSTILDLTAALRIALKIPNVGEQWLKGKPVFSSAQVSEERDAH